MRVVRLLSVRLGKARFLRQSASHDRERFIARKSESEGRSRLFLVYSKREPVGMSVTELCSRHGVCSRDNLFRATKATLLHCVLFHASLVIARCSGLRSLCCRGGTPYDFIRFDPGDAPRPILGGTSTTGQNARSCMSKGRSVRKTRSCSLRM